MDNKISKILKSRFLQIYLIGAILALITLVKLHGYIYEVFEEPSIIGGGPSPMFSFNELKPYYVSQPLNGSSFKFHLYMEISRP